MPNSWLHLQYQDPKFELDKELSTWDTFEARDCGWIEQMRPFIQEFSAPDGTILDPFSGFASTLIAAHLEGRQAVGIEIEENRFYISRKRLEKLGIGTVKMLNGDCNHLLKSIEPVDLIITNIPYFGSSFKSAEATQVYTSNSYGDYLCRIRESLKQFKCALKPAAHIVCMAQNIHIGQQFIPQAWDIAKLLSEQFRFIEERVIVYDKPPVDNSESRSNRAHEYVLIAQHLPKTIDLNLTVRIAQEIQKQFPGAVVFGGMANWLNGAVTQPSDLDIFLPFDPALIEQLIGWLAHQEFDITRWGKPFSYDSVSLIGSDTNYLRAERQSADGSLLLIDIAFSKDVNHYLQLTKSLQLIEGVNCSLQLISFND